MDESLFLATATWYSTTSGVLHSDGSCFKRVWPREPVQESGDREAIECGVAGRVA
jgi:hypothetical protein